MDRRRTVRYSLRLPVIFTWRDRKRAKQKEGGFTRDIGTSGLYVVSNRSLPVGTKLQLDIHLPCGEGVRYPIALLRATGSVVRTGESGEEHGFAAAGNVGFIAPNSHAGSL